MRKVRKRKMNKEFIWIMLVVVVWVVIIYMIVKTIGG